MLRQGSIARLRVYSAALAFGVGVATLTGCVAADQEHAPGASEQPEIAATATPSPEMLFDKPTTGFSAAIKLPRAIRLDPNATELVYTLEVEGRDPQREIWAMSLEQDPTVTGLLAEEETPDAAIYVFAVPVEAQQRLSDVQRQIAEFREAGVSGAFSIGISPRNICREAPLEAGLQLVDMYWRTDQTDGFAPIAADVDLRELIGGGPDLFSLIPRCDRG